MEQIIYATEKDISRILELMNNAAGAETPADWYVTDDEDFVRRHMGGVEGYTLKYIIDSEIAAFLIVRHPGEAEDNLGRYLQGNSQYPIDLSAVAHMESAAVHPAHRGKGLQSKLLQQAEEIERAKGTKFLMATVHPDNNYSLRNLEAAGYKCILETEKYGGLRRKVMCRKL